MADCLSGDARQERFDLINYAVDTLGRNPATGEAIHIKASKKVAFRAAKELKEAV